MKKFLLKWIDGSVQEVEGEGIADACRKAGLSKSVLSRLDSYETEGKKVQVASQTSCGCVFHSEEGLACKHDLEFAGLGDIEEIESEWVALPTKEFLRRNVAP